MRVKQEMFVHLLKYEFEDVKYHLFNFDASNSGYVLVGKQEIEFDVPENFDPTPAKIAMFQKDIEKAEKEFSERVMKLKDEISKLQALTYEVSA